jgi:hypothetical protein
MAIEIFHASHFAAGVLPGRNSPFHGSFHVSAALVAVWLPRHLPAYRLLLRWQSWMRIRRRLWKRLWNRVRRTGLRHRLRRPRLRWRKLRLPIDRRERDRHRDRRDPVNRATLPSETASQACDTDYGCAAWGGTEPGTGRLPLSRTAHSRQRRFVRLARLFADILGHGITRQPGTYRRDDAAAFVHRHLELARPPHPVELMQVIG